MQDLIEKARHRRRGMIGENTDAYRLFDGGADGMPGVFIDDFAGHWLVQTREVEFPEALCREPDPACRSLWWKNLDPEKKHSPEWKWGQRPEQPFPVRENGLRFLIDFSVGYSQGLFLDQRLNRAETARRVKAGGALLNCFAYTCGFSVAAAGAGAETTSVDLSKRWLEWGRLNFQANALDDAAHSFCRGDSFEWLRRFARKERQFDGVILDPPTFSRNQKGKVFRVEKDYGSLAALAARVVAPGGWMLCCTNCRALDEGALRRMLRSGIGESGRGLNEMAARPMPPEYRDEKYLKSYWIELA